MLVRAEILGGILAGGTGMWSAGDAIQLDGADPDAFVGAAGVQLR